MNLFKHMRVGTKLIAGFLCVVILGGIVACVGIFGLSRLNDSSDRLYNQELLAISYVKEANINLIYAGRARANFLLATTEQERQAARKNFDDAASSMKDWLGKSKPLFYTERSGQMITELEDSIRKWLPSADAFLKAAAGKSLAAADPELLRLGAQASELNKVVDEQFTALTKVKEEQGKLTAEAGAALYRDLSTLMIVLTVISALFGVAIGVVLTRMLSRQLGGEPTDAANIASAIAAGDLTQTIDTSRATKGSVIDAMNAMQESLRDVVGTVRSSSDGIATASAQIAQGNLDLSQRTEEQASALEETSATMSQLSSTVRSTADNARQADQLARASSEVAVNGGVVVDQVVETMKGINDSSTKIAEIIGVIDGIAFQTNILALNAAVEAARAGEQGRGFAVVASEVRNLAQRSAEAAREIKGLIGTSVERVGQGTELVAKAGSTMQDVVGSIRRVTDLMGEISTASTEQSTGVTQVEQAVSQMDQVTQQNAALVEESAAAAASLESQAQELVKAVAVFKLPEGQRGFQAVRPPAPAAVERRGPGRAANVTRPKFGAAARPAAAAAPKARPQAAAAAPQPATATGTDDWTSF